MKAILVIDMPSCCNSCRYCEYIQSDEYTRCILECREVKNDMKKPNWCPLKPMSQKNKYDVEKYATVDYENNVTLGHYLNHGWNDCIDEILGEKE